jgi:hypothetical protein
MCRCLAMLGLLALIAQGCAKKPASYPLKPTHYALTAFRVDYQTWDCPELADEADLLKDALAVASEHRAGNTAAHLKARAEAVHKARTLKKCSA